MTELLGGQQVSLKGLVLGRMGEDMKNMDRKQNQKILAESVFCPRNIKKQNQKKNLQNGNK